MKKQNTGKNQNKCGGNSEETEQILKQVNHTVICVRVLELLWKTQKILDDVRGRIERGENGKLKDAELKLEGIKGRLEKIWDDQGCGAL